MHKPNSNRHDRKWHLQTDTITKGTMAEPKHLSPVNCTTRPDMYVSKHRPITDNNVLNYGMHPYGMLSGMRPRRYFWHNQ